MRRRRSAILAMTLFAVPIAGHHRSAYGQDFDNLVVEVDELPDLAALFRRKAPIMGACPMGVDAVAPEDLPPDAHLLHLGTTGFYLDYRHRISLTDDQVEALRQLRDEALERGGALAERMDAAEQDLWTLTGAPAPDPAAIQASLETVGDLRDAQRWTYLEAVLRASEVLTPAQRAALVE